MVSSPAPRSRSATSTLGLPHRQSQRRAARRVLGPGTAARVRNLQAERWPHGEAAARPRRGPAVDVGAGQSVQRAAQGPHRSLVGRRRAHLARQEDPAAARPARDEVHQAHPDPERAPDEVLGPADVPRRDSRPARGLGQPSERRATRSRSSTATSSARSFRGARRRPIPSCRRRI